MAKKTIEKTDKDVSKTSMSNSIKKTKTEPKVEIKTEPKLETKKQPLSNGVSKFNNDGTILGELKTPMNSKVIELLNDISKKLDKLIGSVSDKKQEKPEHIDLKELQLSELKFLKELANETIILNKYPGGNQELIRMSANLVNKIDIEIISRLRMIN